MSELISPCKAGVGEHPQMGRENYWGQATPFSRCYKASEASTEELNQEVLQTAGAAAAAATDAADIDLALQSPLDFVN